MKKHLKTTTISVENINKDIAERMKAAEALRIKDVAIATSIDGIAISDLAGNLNYVNDAFLKLWGYDNKQEVIGKSYSVFWEDPTQAQVVVEALQRTGQWSGELNGKKKDGSIISVQLSGNIILNSAGNALGMMASFLDITDRKRTAENLRERVKELNCLYGISILMGRYDISLDEILRGTVELIPPALQYSDIAGARIVLKDRKFQTENFHKTAWMQSRDIVVHGKSAGCVDVCYLKPAPTDGPTFLKEENKLLDIITERLGRIVERKRMEEALRESEARYNALFTSAAEGILVADLKTEQFRYANLALCRMFGYTEEELMRMSVADIHPKESLDHVMAEFEAQARGEKTLAPDIPCLRKDGTLFYANISGIVMVLDGRHCNVGFFTDITEHKQAQEVLRQSEEKYRNLTENLSELVFRVDPKTNAAIYVNKAVEDIYGYTVEEWLKDPMLWINTIYPDDKEMVVAEVVKAQKKLGSVIITCRIIRKDKTMRWVEDRISWEKDRQGHAVSMNVLMSDITERKLMQEKILTSEKLAVMGRLVADVSHELNNPLAIVIGGSQLILSRLGKKLSPFKSQLETVLRNAKRCKSVINNLLGHGRTIGKKGEVINLPDLIREAIDDVNYQYDMSAIETVLNYPISATQASPPSLRRLAVAKRYGGAWGEKAPLRRAREARNKMANAEIAGNRSALLSVFINLIRNARQAMGENGRLTITIQKEDKKHLRIEIHDTGIGMSKEQKAKLFKPFTSGWNDATSAQKALSGHLPDDAVESNGLGLATSLGIVATHGGSISAESEGVGKGATFTILLPCKFKGKK